MDNNKATFLLEFKQKGIKIIEQTVEELEKLGVDSKDASDSLDKLAESFKDLTTDAKKATKPIEQVDDSVENIGNSVKKNESRVKRFFGSLNKGFNDSSKSAKNLNEQTTVSSVRISSLVKSVAAFITIKQTLDYTKGLVTSLDNVAINAQKAGVEFNKFNALGQVANRFGIGIEQLSDKFIQLNEFVSEASEWGSGSGFEVLTTLNLNAKELAKLDPASQLERIMQAMQGLDVSYQKQLLSALSLDDLLPVLQNYEKVQERIDRLNAAGLNIDSLEIRKSIDSLNNLFGDLNNFNQIVLTTLYDEIAKIYNIEPGKDSLLNGENARAIAIRIAGIIDAVGKLINALGILGQTAKFIFTTVIAVPTLLEASLLSLGDKIDTVINVEKVNKLKNKIRKATTDEERQVYEKALQELYANIKKENDKVAKDIDNSLSGIINSLSDQVTSITKDTTALYKDINSVDKSLESRQVKNLTVTSGKDSEINDKMKLLQRLRFELSEVEKAIESTNLDIQINPEDTPKLNAKLQQFIKNKNNILKILNDKFPASGVSLINVKQGELELKQAKDALTQYYKDVKAKNKEAFDEQVKVFQESVTSTEISLDLGLIDKSTAIKQLQDTFINYEEFVKNNGDIVQLLQVQQEKYTKIKALKQESLEIENLTLELLQLQGKEVEAVEIKRARAISTIQDNVKNLEEQAKQIDLTNKIFDLQKFQANLSEAEKNISNLETQLNNTDFFNTKERLRLEKEITEQKEIQSENQKALGIYTEKANKDAILTVKQVKELDVLLENSLIDNFSDFIAGTKSAKEAFNDFATDFLKNISKMILQQLYLNAISAINGGESSSGGIASFIFGSMPTFHTGIGGSGSSSSFQPKVQIPGVTKHDEGLAILRKGETVSTKNQQYNNSMQNSNSTTTNNLYLDSQQLSNAALNNTTGEELVMKIITKNRNTIKNL